MMNGNEIDMALSFILLLRFLSLWPQGCFLQSSLVGVSHSSPARLPRAFGACWWGRWNLRFVCSSLYLFYWGQIALFVYSPFWWLEIVMDRRIVGVWGIFLYGRPFISVTSSGCAGDVSWFFVFKTVCLPGNDFIILIFGTFIIC